MKKLNLSKLGIKYSIKDETIETCYSCPFFHKDEYGLEFCYLDEINAGLKFEKRQSYYTDISKNCPLPDKEIAYDC